MGGLNMNPFIYGMVVKGDNFYDREKESKQIIDTLSGGNNMVLYAPRRYGKTSLVFHVMKRLETQGFLCIYFDFMPAYSVEAFVRLYTKTLAAKQSSLQKFAATFTSIVKKIRPTIGFSAEGNTEFSVDLADTEIDETTVAEVLDLTEKLDSRSKRVIVFFDEFQAAEKLSNINFESLLRSKIQQQKNTNYLFFGSKTHLMTEMFNDRSRAFYQAASQMTIGALPEADTIAYLQRSFRGSNISIDVKTAKYLIEQSGNIPHYIQLLASEVWQELVGRRCSVKPETIDACAARVLANKSDYYMELFDRQANSKKQLLQALVKSGENIFSAAFMRTNRLQAGGTIQRAVRELSNDGLVDKTENGYIIADPFFRLFVKSTM
jgi:hypothetical protein